MKCTSNKRKINPVTNLMKYIAAKLKYLGVKITYSALLLYYAYQRKDTPRWAKNVIIGALGYLLSPIDTIPDLTPFLGFTDDFGVLSFALVTIACYINEDVRSDAKEKVHKLFNNVYEEDLQEVDSSL